MPLSDRLVYSAFTEYVAQNKKEKRVRCRYCQRVLSEEELLRLEDEWME